jgi:hypothetical protein
VRLCLAPGTWQIVMLAAALRQNRANGGAPCADRLLLFEPDGTAALKEWMLHLAPAVWSWDRVEWASDVLQPKLPEHDWPWPIREYEQAVRRAAGGGEVRELWISQIEMFAYRLAMETYPRAALTVYEDGYWSPPVLRDESLLERYEVFRQWLMLALRGRLKAHDASRRLATWRIASAYWRRIAGLYAFLPANLEPPPPYNYGRVAPIAKEHLVAALDGARGVLREREIDVGSRDVLLLPQPFVQFMHGRPAAAVLRQEIEFYRGIVRELLAKGYDVVWKDHPRGDESVFGEVARGHPAGRVRKQEFPARLPVELMPGVQKFRHCVSITSSALFYLDALHGVRRWTCADRLMPLVTAERAEYLALPQFLRECPVLADLPDAG